MGGRCRVKVVKNKVAAPFKQTEFDLMYNEGISHEGEIIALGEKYEILQKSGASYSFTPVIGKPSAGVDGKSSNKSNEKLGEEVKLGRGYDATRQFLKENSKVRDEILKRIRAKLNEQ